MSATAPFAVEEIQTTAEPRSELAGCVSIIIPIYNEVHFVEELFRQVEISPVEKEIILVDDGSSDGTRERLRQLEGRPGVTILFHRGNHGKGAAIRTALEYARGEYVLVQDCDLEYDPRDYGALLRPLQNGAANVVYGVRPKRPERGLHFFLGAEFLTVLTNLLYGSRIHDEATGYKAFRRSVLEKINLECRRFEFCPEVTAKISRLGERIAEVPIAYSPRNSVQGKKIRWTDGVSAIWTLLRYRVQPSRRMYRRI